VAMPDFMQKKKSKLKSQPLKNASRDLSDSDSDEEWTPHLNAEKNKTALHG
jgi:hypothetical protein